MSMEKKKKEKKDGGEEMKPNRGPGVKQTYW